MSNRSLDSEGILDLIRQLETETYTESILNPNDGYVFVENQVIYVIDAQAGGRQPSLVPSKSVELYVNGIKVPQKMVVYAKDRITWKLTQEEVKPYRITISENQMEVYLTIDAERLISHILRTAEPCLIYRPETEGIPLTDTSTIKEQICNEITALQIVAEINEVEIGRAVDEKSGEPVLIAKGIPEIPGRDGYVETFFGNTTEHVLNELNGRVDYRERIQIPSVKQGDPLGVIHPAVPGTAGENVFGMEVKPLAVSDAVVITRRNVSINSNGQAIALKAGRPSLTGDKVKYFDVQTIYTVEGDVDLSVGNVYFNGDVVIKGDVKETMRVEASGNVYIYGSAHSATIISAQNVYIKGHATKCEVYGGKLGLLYSRIYNYFQQLIELYEGLERDAKRVQKLMEERGKTVPIGQIVSLLVQEQYKQVLVIITQYEESIQGAGKMLPMEFTISGRLLQLFKNTELMGTIKHFQDFRKVYEYLLNLKLQIENSVFEESDIVVGSGNFSKLATNGSLIVTGQGLVHCEVEVERDCLFKHAEGSCKGGSLYAKRKISMAEAGTPFGRNTFLHAGESVRLGRANGVTIRVGDRMIELLEDKKDVCLWIDNDGNLNQSCLRMVD